MMPRKERDYQVTFELVILSAVFREDQQAQE